MTTIDLVTEAIIKVDRGSYKNPQPSEEELACYRNMAMAALSVLDSAVVKEARNKT